MKVEIEQDRNMQIPVSDTSTKRERLEIGENYNKFHQAYQFIRKV